VAKVTRCLAYDMFQSLVLVNLKQGVPTLLFLAALSQGKPGKIFKNILKAPETFLVVR